MLQPQDHYNCDSLDFSDSEYDSAISTTSRRSHIISKSIADFRRRQLDLKPVYDPSREPGPLKSRPFRSEPYISARKPALTYSKTKSTSVISFSAAADLRDSDYNWINSGSSLKSAVPRTLPSYHDHRFLCKAPIDEQSPRRKSSSRIVVVEKLGNSAGYKDLINDSSSESGLKRKFGNIFGKQDKIPYVTKSFDEMLRNESSYLIKRKPSKTKLPKNNIPVKPTKSNMPAKQPKNNIPAKPPLCYPDSTSNSPLAFPSAAKIISKYGRSRSNSLPTQKADTVQAAIHNENLAVDGTTRVQKKPKKSTPFRQEASSQIMAGRYENSVPKHMTSAIPALDQGLVPRNRVLSNQEYDAGHYQSRAPVSFATQLGGDVFYPAGEYTEKLLRRNTVANVNSSKQTRLLSLDFCPANVGEYNNYKRAAAGPQYRPEARPRHMEPDVSTTVSRKDIQQMAAYLSKCFGSLQPSPETIDSILAHPGVQKAIGFFVVAMAIQTVVSQLRTLSWSLISRAQSFSVISLVIVTVAGLYAACEDKALFAAPFRNPRNRNLFGHASAFYSGDGRGYKDGTSRQISVGNEDDIPLTWNIGGRLVELTLSQRRALAQKEETRNRDQKRLSEADEAKPRRRLRFKMGGW